MGKITNKNQYKPRIIDKQIDLLLNIFGAICVEGSKWCGKTRTSSFHANSEFLVGDPFGFLNRKLAEIEPYSVLKGDALRLIDEWQEVPLLWNETREYIDKNNEKGQIILTGSSTTIFKGIIHSRTGRIKNIRMNTMSLFGSGDSNGSISLKDLLNGKFETKIFKGTNLERLVYLIVRVDGLEI